MASHELVTMLPEELETAMEGGKKPAISIFVCTKFGTDQCRPLGGEGAEFCQPVADCENCEFVGPDHNILRDELVKAGWQRPETTISAGRGCVETSAFIDPDNPDDDVAMITISHNRDGGKIKVVCWWCGGEKKVVRRR